MNKLKKLHITILTSIFFILIFTGLIVWWHIYTPTENISIQIPGADNRPQGTSRSAKDIIIGEFFMQYADISSSLTGKWCGFRGKNRDNIIETQENIDFSQKDFQIVWKVETGEGHAAPVIYKGRAYFLDYNEQLSSDALRCFDLETGTELWRRWYRVPMKRNHGFSRTVPVIDDDFIITLGPEGHIMCCDPISGNLKWTLDMQKEFKTEVPFWYAGQCPLVDENSLIIAPAGEEILFAGLNPHTGDILWTTANTLNYKMSHSSVIPMTILNKKMYIYIGIGGICAISAEKDDIGTILWETNKWQPSVVAPSPVQISNNQIFVVAGYGAGGALIQIDRTNNKWNATIITRHKPDEGLSSEQQTPIFYNNHIYSVMPKDGGGNRGKLVCYSPTNLNTPVWTSASDERFGLGPYMVINAHFFVFKDDGELYIYKTETKGMKLIKKQQIIENGTDAWGPMAYADGYLIVRDSHWIYCSRIKH